ncbi:hypothetical protein [Undibacterium rugosum]|uniref:hypothetical protein n=1 Tax=Undibacterium rugosum TaxID=2762291 RepID=UPI001B841584|nr:hypothetical protein [Undibacterium rugosum]MBR7779733.1 hypothetical protein [Undibacterium rugosum]
MKKHACKDAQSSRRRASRALPLLLAGSASLVACSEQPVQELTQIRDEYQNIEDCRKDWGDGPACELQPGSNLQEAALAPASSAATSNTSGTSSYTSGYTSSGSHGYYGGGGHYLGPSYIAGEREASRQSMGLRNSQSDHASGHSVSRTSGGRGAVSRGGFGGSAHGHSGGG